MENRECAEIVQSGTWLYDGQLSTDVWIVRQNFGYAYEGDDFEWKEDLNEDGEAYQVVFARSGRVVSIGPVDMSRAGAVKAAEEMVSSKIEWTNHILQRLYGGHRYSLVPIGHA